MNRFVETVAAPSFQSQDFARANKKPGLSAIVRLQNEQEFGAAALESIAPFFDEIIIVYHECTDATPDIVAAFAQKYPAQVKAYHYLPHVIPYGTYAHLATPPSSVHSIIHYYNFALSKASFQIRCKWDGDQIADPASFGNVVTRLRELKRGSLAWWLSPWALGYWYYTGVNLHDHRGEIRVPRTRPFIGKWRDHGFFPAGAWIRYRHYIDTEYLFTRTLKHTFVGCLFYHLKGMKQGPSLRVSQYKLNPNSRYVRRTQEIAASTEFFTLEELRAREPTTRHLPDPAALNIHTTTTSRAGRAGTKSRSSCRASIP